MRVLANLSRPLYRLIKEIVPTFTMKSAVLTTETVNKLLSKGTTAQ